MQFLAERILVLLAQAVAEVKAAQVEAQVAWVAQEGNLVLLVEFYPDGVFGSFVDDTYKCWDNCGGIIRQHRSGWCRTNPEHADLDCNCDYAEAEAEYYASLQAEAEFSPEAVEQVRIEERDALDSLAEEPF